MSMTRCGRPFAMPFAAASWSAISAISGRAGMYCAVTARPTSFLPGWRICQPPSNWLGYPARVSTDQISSELSSRIFSNRASGTFGRPSSNRPYGFLAVYFSRSARGKENTCAPAPRGKKRIVASVRVRIAAVYVKTARERRPESLTGCESRSSACPAPCTAGLATASCIWIDLVGSRVIGREVLHRRSFITARPRWAGYAQAHEHD